MVCAFVLAYGCDSSEDDGLDDVRVFTAAAEISGVTGSGAINPTQLFATLGGPILMVDGASGSIVLLGTDGVPSIFASRDEILAATGGMTASIGPLDQIRLGALAGQIVAVDSVSGLIVRFALDGTPTLHTTEAQVIQATGETEADLRLPRALTSNQIIAQDLESGHILVFGNTGTAQILTEIDDLVTATGLTAGESVIAQWVTVGSAGFQYGRVGTTGPIVRLRVNGQVERHVTRADLADLFANLDEADLRIHDLAGTTGSSSYLVLVGTATRGLAVVLVKEDGTPEVLTSEQEFTQAASAGYDITDIGILESSLLPFAIDGGNMQILVLTGQSGTPRLLATRAEIELAAGTDSPVLTIGAPLRSEAVIVPDFTTDNVLRAE